jgi:uncharacterized LabA/DUF88 family protein
MKRFYKKPKPTATFAFIDSQNLNLGIQKVGWKMDWKKFREYLSSKYAVTHAYMFIGHMPEYEALYHQLHEQGYLIVLKPTHETVKLLSEKPKDTPKPEEHAEEKKQIKGNIDAELVLWAMKERKNYKDAIIVSGDGDFYCLAEYLQSVGQLKHIMTPNWQYSTLLKPFEDKIIRLDELRRDLSYRNHKVTAKR